MFTVGAGTTQWKGNAQCPFAEGEQGTGGIFFMSVGCKVVDWQLLLSGCYTMLSPVRILAKMIIFYLFCFCFVLIGSPIHGLSLTF